MAPSETKFKVAAVHASPIFMNKSATLAKVISLIEQAASEQVRFLAFPETFVPGYPYFIECYPPITQAPALARYAEESVVVSSDLAAVAQACKEKNVGISLGVSERMEGGYTLFNSQVMMDSDGEIVSVHRKLQPTYVERMVWAQGGGATLDVKPLAAVGGFNVGGLACWENTMNGARQALIAQNQHIHIAAWPALSTLSGFESTADAQIEALAKTHALTAQVFVLVASNYVDQTCLDWMAANLGPQSFVKPGGGWSSIIHPFCSLLASPVEGGKSGDVLVKAEIDLSDLKTVKVWIDSNGHYARPEVVQFSLDKTPLWGDEKRGEGWWRKEGSTSANRVRLGMGGKRKEEEKEVVVTDQFERGFTM
uniref:Nitrilase n=2 Tax=Podospora anserina (strain S / ATCC MYA-4624 / DSM 980 / FGSC 10383) TaxID=515849 RepID=A0A090CGJ1_PODAN|nr:Putative nitrilase [Podospora anserina S mat+]